MNDKAWGGESGIVLVDNGSLNPKSILEARSLALSLSKHLQQTVVSVSVAHSDGVPAGELGGIRAQLWQSYLEEAVSSGIQEIFAIPLFIGPGFALKKAKRTGLAQSKALGGPVVRWADPLVSMTDRDTVLTDILVENVLRVLDTSKGEPQSHRVLLVDHGSPFVEVTACRNFAASQLQRALGNKVESVVSCSMERREGKEFDFNDPSLQKALSNAKQEGIEKVVICYLFLFSGRHAGSGGDIDQICQKAGWGPSRNLLKTDLIGSNPKLLNLLETRLNSIQPRPEFQ
jgi:sirohydrochlorin ferrochelatase